MLNLDNDARDVALQMFGFENVQKMLDRVRRSGSGTETRIRGRGTESDDENDYDSDESSSDDENDEKETEQQQQGKKIRVADRVFSKTRDIWDFGILCLEMFDRLEGTQLANRILAAANSSTGLTDAIISNILSNLRPADEIASTLLDSAKAALKVVPQQRKLAM